MQINGVLGKISTQDLGCTFVHEHIICCDWSMRMAFRKKWFDFDKVVEMAAVQLKRAKAMGVTTIVDGTAVNIGRDIHLLKACAEASGVNIIAATGMYFSEEPYLSGKPIHQILDLMLEECSEGIEDTKILPGVIKAATDVAGLTPLNKDLLYMTSELQKRTGLPIITHTYAKNKSGLIQQDEFERNGVDLSRVVIGHSGDSHDIGYLIGLMTRGSFIGMDRFGQDHWNPLEDRCQMIAELCRRGWENQMVLGHDYSAYINWGTSDWESTVNADWQTPDYDYSYIHRHALPRLLELGVTQEQFHKMTVDNPRALFEGR